MDNFACGQMSQNNMTERYLLYTKIALKAWLLTTITPLRFLFFIFFFRCFLLNILITRLVLPFWQSNARALGHIHICICDCSTWRRFTWLEFSETQQRHGRLSSPLLSAHRAVRVWAITEFIEFCYRVRRFTTQLSHKVSLYSGLLSRLSTPDLEASLLSC